MTDNAMAAPPPQHLQTLVLNADFRPLSYFPLSLCSWKEAVKAIYLDRVNVVSEYDHKARSPSQEISIPSVVCLKQYVHVDDRMEPALTRHNLLVRDRYECQYCGDEFSARILTLDHVLPRCRDGETSWTNLVAACLPCNSRKGDRIPGVNYMHPLQKPFKPTTRQLQTIARSLSQHQIHESWEDYLL